MKKHTLITLTAAALLLAVFGCQNASKEPAAAAPTTAAPSTPTLQIPGDYCFFKAENRDSTTVKLRFLSKDDIRGEMIWSPWEKDGAVGTLIGKMNAANELELMYSYTIEGSQQTETKIMKIEQGKLFIKEGELMDPKNDGNLVFKDASKATYKEILDAAKCD
jgi:hypothetical protein